MVGWPHREQPEMFEIPDIDLNMDPAPEQPSGTIPGQLAGQLGFQDLGADDLLPEIPTDALGPIADDAQQGLQASPQVPPAVLLSCKHSAIAHAIFCCFNDLPSPSPVQPAPPPPPFPPCQCGLGQA